MPPDSASVENPVYECLSPEQLVVANIEALMKDRGVTRAVLAKRLNDLGFTTWRHEKTVRNLFDGKRSIRVHELFGFAAALNSSVVVLTSLDTQRAIYTRAKAPKFEICVGSSSPLGRNRYRHLWWGPPGAQVPSLHVNWASWEPGRKPVWAHDFQAQVEDVVEMYELRGWELPAPANEITPEHLLWMGRRLHDPISEDDPTSEELEE